MLFFLARSALCIGLVAAAANGIGSEPLAARIDRSVRDAVHGAGRACLASDDCVQAGTAALSAAAGAARTSSEPTQVEPPRHRPEARAARRPAAIGRAPPA